jgi:hypothetical protein
MGTLKGHIIVGSKNGIRYYYRSSTDEWTDRIWKLNLRDLHSDKIELDMKKYPDMDPEYRHEEISIESNC